jgi:hypothetical protein
VNRRGNDGTRDAKALANVALHLRAKDHFWLKLFNRLLDQQVVICNQRLDAVFFGQRAHIAGEFAIVTTHADNFETHLVTRNTRGGFDVCAISKDEHALAR